MQVHLHFLVNQNFSRNRKKGLAAIQMEHSSTSSEISFHGLPSESNHPSIRKQIESSLSLHLTVLLFLENSHLQSDI